jgi:hypothetical protein
MAEFYSGQALTKQETGLTEVTALSVDVDRSLASGAKDFLVIASWSAGNNDVSAAKTAVKLWIDSVDYTDYQLIAYTDDLAAQGPFMAMKKISLSNDAHTVEVRFKGNSNTDGDEAFIQSVNIVVVEAPANLQYNESEGVSNQVAESYLDKVTLTYDSLGGDMLYVATADVAWVDESDPGAIRLTDEDTEIIRHEPDGFVGSANDGLYHSVGLVALSSAVSSGTRTLALEYKGGGTGDDINIKNARIFALPLIAFITYYTAANNNQSVTSATYTNLITLNPTVNAADHIAFFGSQQGGGTFNNVNAMKVLAPTADDYVLADNYGPGEPNYAGNDNAENPTSFATIWGKNLGSGSATWTVQFASESGSQTHYADRNSILVIQVGSDEGFSAEHTTDSSKKVVFTKTHNTDSLKRKAFEKTHTTDALNRTVTTKTHTTDALKRKVTQRTHTTNSFLFGAFEKSHTTDSLLLEEFTVEHTTDSNKRKETTQTHTTDSFITKAFLRTHTTDALKLKEVVSSHTTDALKRKETIREHSTDALKHRLFTVIHSTDTLLRKVFTKTHTTSAYKHKANSQDHDTDTNKRKALVKSHTTDSELFGANKVSHLTSAYKKLISVLSIAGAELPDPTESRIIPLYKWGRFDTIGGKDRRDVMSQKYRYEIRWGFMKKDDYDNLESLVNSGAVVLLQYNRYPQSTNGVSVIPLIGERTHVAITGTNDFYSNVTLTLTEVSSRI